MSNIVVIGECLRNAAAVDLKKRLSWLFHSVSRNRDDEVATNGLSPDDSSANAQNGGTVHSSQKQNGDSPTRFRGQLKRFTELPVWHAFRLSSREARAQRRARMAASNLAVSEEPEESEAVTAAKNSLEGIWSVDMNDSNKRSSQTDESDSQSDCESSGSERSVQETVSNAFRPAKESTNGNRERQSKSGPLQRCALE